VLLDWQAELIASPQVLFWGHNRGDWVAGQCRSRRSGCINAAEPDRRRVRRRL